MLREQDILKRYESAPELERGDLLAALRDTDGEPGMQLLLRVAREPEPRDKGLRMVAVASLLVRGVDVTDDLIAALSSPSMGFQWAAASMLAHRGDARACEPMLAWLQRKLRKKSRSAWPRNFFKFFTKVRREAARTVGRGPVFANERTQRTRRVQRKTMAHSSA